MRKTISISKDLIAPCGMNCGICSKYLSYINNLKKPQCPGCRVANKSCSYLFENCTGVNSNTLTSKASYCYECDQYPCNQINRMDKRYRNNYEMSVKENLDDINESGMTKFIEEQIKKYQCSSCDGLISIHNRKCFNCEPITRLVEKQGRKY